MSGLAFSALTIFCILLPGFVFQFSYYRSAATGDATGAVDLGSAKSLVLAVLFVIPVHTLWVGLIWLIDRNIAPIGTVDFVDLLPIFLGEPLTDTSTLHANVNAWLLLKVTVFTSSQSAFAVLAGAYVAKLARMIDWPKRLALGSDGAIWHKRLEYVDGNPDWTIVSVTLTLGKETYLYYGILEEYQLTPTGELKYLVFKGAARRNIAETDENRGPHELPGEYFVLSCKNVETVDIDYFWIEPEGAI